MEIKSATTIQELEKLFSDQLRHNQGYAKSAKSVEPYYDTKDVLNPLKPFASETCLCTKDLYRLNNNRVANERQFRSPSPSPSTSNTIKGLKLKTSIDEFVHLASDCYDKCINIYLDNLNDCNRRAELIKSPSGYAGKRSLKPKKINDVSLTYQIQKLNINLDSFQRDDYFQFHRSQTPVSPQPCSQKAMSCNDTNNNSTDGTNQLKDPPKIILSDHSTNQSIQGETKEFSDSDNSASSKTCLTIPLENFYSSEARPP